MRASHGLLISCAASTWAVVARRGVRQVKRRFFGTIGPARSSRRGPEHGTSRSRRSSGRGPVNYYAVRSNLMLVTLLQRGDPGLLVLVSLAEGPKHGYALTKDIERFAGVSLGPGSLYGSIARLEARGLIEPLPAEDRRNPYRLTANGAAALRDELKQLARTAALGLARLGSMP